jgi:hypothetical protein
VIYSVERRRGKGETGEGCGVTFGAKHPWRGEAGATLGGRTWRDLVAMQPGIGRCGVGERADRQGPRVSERRETTHRGRKE